METHDRPTKMTPPGPDIDSFIEALRCESPVVYDIKLTEHVNVRELKALTDEVPRRSVRGIMICAS